MAFPFYQLSRARVTWGLVLLLILIHGCVESSGGYEQVADFYVAAGLTRDGLLSGHVWQLLSYGFLHGSWFHLGCNVFCLLLLGARVEFMLGAGILVKVFLLGVVGGALCHLLMGGQSGSVLVGASAGCIALLLLITTLSPQSRMVPLPLSAKNLGAGVLISALLLSLMNPGLALPVFADIGKTASRYFGDELFQVGHACHLGGSLTGWIFGRWLLRQRVDLHALRADRARREKNSGGD